MGRVSPLCVSLEQPIVWQASPSAGAAGARSPSLDFRTLNDSGSHGVPIDTCGWRVTLLDFGDGVVEATAVFQSRRRRLKSPSPVDDSESPPRADRFDRELRLRSARRARQSMRRRVYALSPDRMLTLTKRGKFDDIDAAWSAWTRFERVCSKFWGARWRYVAVPERHADGTYHIHVALQGFYDVGMMRRFWFRALGGTGRERGSDTPGNVDMAFNRTGRGSRVRIARYLRKYLAKDLESCVRGRRSFSASRGLVPIRVARWSEPVHLGLAAPLVVKRRVRALVGAVDLDFFDWSEAGIEGFTVRTAGT